MIKKNLVSLQTMQEQTHTHITRLIYLMHLKPHDLGAAISNYVVDFSYF